MPLIFSHLSAYAERSIVLVQIHHVNGRTGVLVTEPSDNPSQSSINATELEVAEIFQSPESWILQGYPRASVHDAVRTRRLSPR